MTLLLAALLLQADPNLDAVRKALQKTAEESYAYQVKGRFERVGEFVPPGLLTSRMKQYQSVRSGEKLLVKGPEGLWLTAEERLGEKVERPDPDAADMVRTLQGADAPHRILETMMLDVSKGSDPDDRDVNDRKCRRYVLYFRPEALKASLEQAMEKAIEKRTMSRPDEIRWSSSAKGSLRIYLDRADGRLVKAVDERSVKIAYKVPDAPPEVKSYRTDMEFELSDWGKAKAELPDEIRTRLELGK